MFLLTMLHTHSQRLMHFVFIALLILVLRLPSLEEPFDNDSGAVAYSARLITRGEPLYSTHHPGHHLPGAYYTYALAFKLLGDRFYSVKLLLIPWVIANAYLIYLLGLEIQDQRTALFSALLFSILSAHVNLRGSSAEPEIFALLPCTAGILIATQQIQSKDSGKKFIWAGLFCGISFIYKATFFVSILVVIGMILMGTWFIWEERKDIRLAIKRIIGVSIGFLAVFGVTFGYFTLEGLANRFLMVFSYGDRYLGLTNQKSIANVFVIAVLILAFNNVVILIMSFVGVARIFREIHLQRIQQLKNKVVAIGVVAWFFLSILAAGITRYGYPHYALMVVPPLSILAGWELSRLVDLYTKEKGALNGLLNRAGIVMFVSLMMLQSVLSNRTYYSLYMDYRLGRIDYFTFVREAAFDGAIYLRNLSIAKYIDERTTPDEYIYHWTDFPQVYYLADRKAPIDAIWPTQAEMSGSYTRIFVGQTRYIIMGSSLYLPEPSWMQEELDKAYQLEAIIDGQRIYRRIKQ